MEKKSIEEKIRNLNPLTDLDTYKSSVSELISCFAGLEAKNAELESKIKEIEHYKKTIICSFCGHETERFEDHLKTALYMAEHMIACKNHPLRLECEERVTGLTAEIKMYVSAMQIADEVITKLRQENEALKKEVELLDGIKGIFDGSVFYAGSQIDAIKKLINRKGEINELDTKNIT